MARIAQDAIEVNHRVIGATPADPSVDSLPFLFEIGCPETLEWVALDWIQGAAEDLQSLGMSAVDDLAMALNDLADGDCFRWVADQRRDEDVRVALQHDEVAHTALYEHIAIEPGQGAGPDEVMQHAIADDTGIDHGHLGCARSGLQAQGQ